MMDDGQTMWGADYGTGWLMKHPAAFADWQTLRARHINAVRSWWTKHRALPFSATAQEALTTMRSHHRTQDRTYMRNHHVTGSATWSYRGWMGLGGAWGGFGW